MSVTRALPGIVRSSPILATRKYASQAAAKPAGYVPTAEEWIAQRDAVKAHAHETTQLWRRISLYVCVPATIILALYVKRIEDEHHEHVEHLKAESGGELPEPEFAWLGKRAKPFPWGNNSLFFNPETNRDFDKKDE